MSAAERVFAKCFDAVFVYDGVGFNDVSEDRKQVQIFSTMFQRAIITKLE